MKVDNNIHYRALPKRGFTIVELIIVIIVIGIIASITIVAFGTVQKKARNQARIAAAVQIVKMLDAHTFATGTMIPGPPYCVPTGNADENSDGLGDCDRIYTAADPAAPPQWSEKVATNTAITAGGLRFQYPQDVITAANGDRYRGVSVTYGSTNRGMNGVLQPYFVYFRLEGTGQNCTSEYSVGAVANPDPLYMIVPASYYGSGNGVTTCAYTLRHPSSI